jgi:hypothetical protein
MDSQSSWNGVKTTPWEIQQRGSLRITCCSPNHDRWRGTKRERLVHIYAFQRVFLENNNLGCFRREQTAPANQISGLGGGASGPMD